MKVYNITQKTRVPLETFEFSGGEVQVKLDPYYLHEGDKVSITHRIINSKALMELLLVTNSLHHLFIQDIEIFIPYTPYARQDRVMVKGEALSIELFAELINAQNYSKVSIFDPHSLVAPALIKNVKIISNESFVIQAFENLESGCILISPDAGALKKVETCAKTLSEAGIVIDPEIVIASKTRDVTNGKILKTSIPHHPRLKGQTCVIIDDICDGGRTFIELAKVLKAEKDPPAKVILLVSHGIFSAGLHPIFEYIDQIFTTNSFKDIEGPEDKFFQICIY